MKHHLLTNHPFIARQHPKGATKQSKSYTVEDNIIGNIQEWIILFVDCFFRCASSQWQEKDEAPLIDKPSCHCLCNSQIASSAALHRNDKKKMI